MKKTIKFLTIIILVCSFSSCKCTHTWTEATCKELKTCVDCGATEGELLLHEWVEATCTEPKKCINCGEKEGEANGHSVRIGKCPSCGVLVKELVKELNKITTYANNITTGLNNCMQDLQSSYLFSTDIYQKKYVEKAINALFSTAVDINAGIEISSQYLEFAGICWDFKCIKKIIYDRYEVESGILSAEGNYSAIRMELVEMIPNIIKYLQSILDVEKRLLGI